MTGTDVAVAKPQELVGGNPDQVRLSIEESWRVAQFLSASKMFQNKGSTMSPEECMAVVMMGQGLGIPPAVAMLNIHMIEGRPSMAAELLGYFIKSSGKYDFRSEHERDEAGNYVACTVRVFDVRSGEFVGESTYTMGDAQKAGLIRPRGNWEKHPGAMLHARAVSQALRWHCPDAIPIRPYALDEIEGPASGVAVVNGEPAASPAQVEQVVADALAASEEPEVEVTANEVEVEPGTQETVGTEESVQDADVAPVSPPPDTTATGSFDDIDGRLRADIPLLPQTEKEFIKATILERGWEFKMPSILRLMGEQGKTTIGDWLAWAHSPAGFEANVVASGPGQEESLPAGVTGRETGSQTAPTVSDAQMGMLHARFGECLFTEQEKRTFLKRYAQCESTRMVRKADVNDLLEVLNDIKNGDDATRRAYVGGDE